MASDKAKKAKSKAQNKKNKTTTKKNTSTYRGTKNSPRFAFKYNIKMSLGGNYAIYQQFIKYVLIDYDYENNVMPVIYVCFSATKAAYDAFMNMDNQRNSKVYFELTRHNAYSDTSLNKLSIKGEFSYLPSTSNLNYTEELDLASADASYKTITIALISEELLNRSKMYINRIFTNTSTNNLVAIALEGLEAAGKVILKAPTYSGDLENMLIPPMTSRKQFLEYIFNAAPFYDTNFIFFLDFERSYLIDMNGEGCPIDDGTLGTVMFSIDQATASTSYYDGMNIEQKDGAYLVHINPANANATLNRSQDRIANRLIAVSEDGYKEPTGTSPGSDVKLEVNPLGYSTDKLVFKRSEDATLLKNIMESNTLFFTVQKPYIDAYIFTPNKVYTVTNYAKGNEYNGIYTMAYKREIITNDEGAFNESSEFGLRKVGNITSTGGAGAQSASSASQQSNHYYKNTSGNSNGRTGSSNSAYKPANTSASVIRSESNSSGSSNKASSANATLNSPNMAALLSNAAIEDIDGPVILSAQEDIEEVIEEPVVVTPKRHINERPLIDASGPKRVLKETPNMKNLMRKFD